MKANSEEKQGLIYDAAKLIATISQTDIPKIAVIADYAIGYGYVLWLQNRSFDYALAFANAKSLPLHRKPQQALFTAKAESRRRAFRNSTKLIEKYAQEEMNPFVSAKAVMWTTLLSLPYCVPMWQAL